VGYDRAFYRVLAQTARSSARRIVPKVLAQVLPKSVIDVGCGTGSWLAEFARNGIVDFCGVEGDFFPADMLEIPRERFVVFDLTQPYRCSRRFDLVISLEVAEHLPADCAASFVGSLVRLGPAVLFSAAIPGQGGTHHVNEQWQDYWAELFERHDYVPVDCVRQGVWNDSQVAWWYSQNTLLYCERDYAMATASLARQLAAAPRLPLNIAHPRKLDEAVWRERLARAAFQLGQIIPSGGTFLLIDLATTADAFDCCGRAIPFPQKDGVFSGCPPDSRTAVWEMRPLLSSASHLVVVEPAFWWLSCYLEWFEYVRTNSRLVLETDLMKVFEICINDQAPGRTADATDA
jgi:SAM-dependent methyltransferase